MGEEIMLLSIDQQNRLKQAASNYKKEQRAELTLEESNEIATKIDMILHEIHNENPNAFLTQAVSTKRGVYFSPISRAVKRRRFYDEPATLHPTEYASYVKELKSILK